MKQVPEAVGHEAEQAKPVAFSFHRPDETKPYSKFTRDLQYWRGTKLREYYEALENPQYRRRSTKPTELKSSIDFYERLQGLGLKVGRR